MQIKNIPTDNLYKFIATFCLVLTITTIIAAIGLSINASDKITDRLPQAEALESKYKNCAKQVKGQPFEYEKVEVVKECFSQEDFNKYTALWSVIDKESAWEKRVLLFSSFIVGLLLIASATGFSFWYRRLQVHEDAKAIAELEELKMSSEKLELEKENLTLANELLHAEIEKVKAETVKIKE